MKESYSIGEKRSRSRHLFEMIETKRGSVKSPTRVISFTSGKGGVGKTNLAVNVALALSKGGRSVLLLDADLGLANVDILLGLSAAHTLQDVLAGEKGIDDIILDGPYGLSIIPAASGIESICNLDGSKKLVLLQAMEEISLNFDYLLIDTRAGISSDVMYFNSASGEIVVVVNHEPTSLTDAYATVKVLSQNYGEKTFSVIANDVRDAQEGALAFQKLDRAVSRFLKVRLDYLGCVPTDVAVSSAIQSQRALLELYPSSKAGLAISNIARKIEASLPTNALKGGVQFFFRKLLAEREAVGVER